MSRPIDWHVSRDNSGTLYAAATSADLCPHCWPGHPCPNTPEDRAARTAEHRHTEEER